MYHPLLISEKEVITITSSIHLLPKDAAFSLANFHLPPT
jgi:hypothetical protein